jgi:hypothetical protein
MFIFYLILTEKIAYIPARDVNLIFSFFDVYAIISKLIDQPD